MAFTIPRRALPDKLGGFAHRAIQKHGLSTKVLPEISGCADQRIGNIFAQREREIEMSVRLGTYSVLRFSILLTIVLLSGISCAHPDRKDYSRLKDLVRVEDQKTPLFVFKESKGEFDPDIHKASIEYFENHPALLQKIKTDLACETPRWRLDRVNHRLLFVPEQVQEHASLFESYCKDVVQEVLKRTNLPNPYREIRTLSQERPEISDRGGITAFVVNNVAKEFETNFIFSNEEQKELKIDLGGKIFLDELGSYTSNISVGKDGTCDFAHDGYTLWRDSAKNPYTALMVPIEETLHIALRASTERAIKEQIERSGVNETKDVEKIVEEWTAVEEAIVGGVVHDLSPPILAARMITLPPGLIEKDLKSRSELRRYRYLEKGVLFVRNTGSLSAVGIYKTDPAAFRNFLQNPPEMAGRLDPSLFP
jgi:hypothetical protein